MVCGLAIIVDDSRAGKIRRGNLPIHSLKMRSTRFHPSGVTDRLCFSVDDRRITRTTL
jgi:hypothetical protein